MKTCKVCLKDENNVSFRKWRLKCNSCSYMCSDKQRENKRIYYINNRDSIIKNISNYKNTENYKDVNRIKLSNQRFKWLIWSIRPTAKKLNIMLAEQDYKCKMCWEYILHRNSRHIDHIIPKTKWWAHCMLNIQWLCKHCNLTKYNNILVAEAV